MNKKSIIFIGILILCLIFTSCSAKTDNAEMSLVKSYDMDEAAPAAMPEDGGDFYYGEDESYTQESSSSADSAIDYSEKIIYNVSMGIEVDDPAETAKVIKDKVSEMGGYVSSSYTNKDDEYSSYVNMQIRVPSKGLNSMMEYISSISEVEYENMYTDNITENYYDTVARLEHEKMQAEQYEEIMEKAETIEDILAVSERLSQVQQNIEVYEGRIRMWDSLVDYSTIDINISPTPTIDTDNGLIRVITLGETGRAIVRALNNSWRFVANFFSWLVRVIAALLIPAVIIVPIVIIIVRSIKNKKTKGNSDND